jgi:hypothetical protein
VEAGDLAVSAAVVSAAVELAEAGKILQNRTFCHPIGLTKGKKSEHYPKKNAPVAGAFSVFGKEETCSISPRFYRQSTVD